MRGQLLADRLTIAPEDTGLLLDTLDNHMATLRTAYGPDVWANDNALIREAYQEAVMTLADHRDPRALPDVIRSLETRMDDWRALYGVGGYPQAADRLVPLLANGLRFIDPDRPHTPIPAGLYLSCLAELKDPIAIPVITDTLTWASQHQSWTVATDALDALATFGLDAQPVRTPIRPLPNAPNDAVRAAARATLDALTDRQAPHLARSKPGNGYAQEPALLNPLAVLGWVLARRYRARLSQCWTARVRRDGSALASWRGRSKVLAGRHARHLRGPQRRFPRSN
ncbi:hypothetical protein ACFYPA_29050 [Streptomyces sp. NPDC005775]|uniref:hypothetical protein n=1 Tax=Streptomyces sp. NPDC005775 TaxID=3364729 RepID=UPI0036AB2CF6